MNQLSRHLVLHASIILFAALVFGAPYARSIKQNAELQIINSWRVAHQSLTIGALLLFVMAYVLPMLLVPNLLKVTIAVFFILSGYAFTISTPLAAITKDRGLSAGASGLARLVYVGNIIGAFTSLIAALLLVFATLFST
ncbi:glucan phosphoethanolaminetransferase (alkaline phosphatase superfamily) [Herbaspirillum sp. Sphag1AN]|uniref:hypothetical protein n=1 Tax=unclassified Herbaspirillum TaxID=2624150 RepID=UPI0016074736|nr:MULTISPECIES: hypothetical protein [unclassified Herbaspirillum]MBB3211127.1 glucan phosphoethanolaminetransferase (alkaline phosphatase superfamily) [Herbaspirillum sp. Sphag1AN]MBB3244756.1 glucan phosphoethanolaminetransferase (alkaline phosphatase superfamily) [Herbaspirillum sp. Sphag64]